MPRFYPSRCVSCRKGFLAWRKDSRFCSRQCFRESRFRKPKKLPRMLEIAESKDDMAVSIGDVLGTYSPAIRERVARYPEIVRARAEGKRLKEIERDFGVSDSLISCYANKSVSPKVYRILESCRWLPLKKSEDLDFLVGYARDHGYISERLHTAKIWSADRFELQRIRKRMRKVFMRNFEIKRDRRIYVISTDSLTARALHLAGVPVGRKLVR